MNKSPCDWELKILRELKPQEKRKIKKVLDNKNWGDNIENVAKKSDWKFKGMWNRQTLILLTLKKK